MCGILRSQREVLLKYKPQAALQPTPAEVAEWVGGKLLDSANAPERITGLATLDDASSTELAFAGQHKHLKAAASCSAGLLVIPEDSGLEGRARIEVAEVWPAVVEIVRRLYPDPVPESGVHATAVLGEGVMLGRDVSIGPYCVLGDGVGIGDGAILGPHCSIGPGCKIGEGSRLHSFVALQGIVEVGRRVILHSGVVLGADGFRVVPGRKGALKIPQVGRVVLEDEVEIGANTTIDRAFLNETRIGFGSKIDNLVQIGHNCTIGRHVIIAGCCAMAGSVTIEDGCLIGGHSSFAEKVTVGGGSIIAGRTAVSKSLPAKSIVAGYPVMPIRDFHKSQAQFRRLPEIAKRLARLEED
jgi:UDP-3-O-[3-hydroxymyristoyl] glucosamine N-acyltransferase